MERKMRRKSQELDRERCMEILKEEWRGVLSMKGDQGYPYSIPMNFYYEDGKIYFHGGRAGYKMDCIRRDPRISFCVYDKGFRKEGHWALNISSVCVRGQAHIIEDRVETETYVRKLAEKYMEDPQELEEDMKNNIAATTCFFLEIEEMTGKLVNES